MNQPLRILLRVAASVGLLVLAATGCHLIATFDTSELQSSAIQYHCQADVIDQFDLRTTVYSYDDSAHGVLAANDNTQGRIESAGDVDLFALNLTAGQAYDVTVKSFADGLGTLAQSQLRLRNADGDLVYPGGELTASLESIQLVEHAQERFLRYFID